ncbi:SDR family NAD(P)-dependent oxidoreductase, partial [Pseudomonas aeruginosa]|nr:SDR family NAD(P)-dependent oxidoreductase [Pseudomonas aeruginosa]
MNDRFRGKVALVSGAAQGIGLGVARRLLAEGARVVAVDRSELVHELAGDACLCLVADLERYAECQRALERTLERFGRLDILVNNVGGTIWAKPYQHYAEQEIEAELRRSLLPTLWCCRAALPAMLEQGSGAIVNVSSVATRGVNRVPYGAAKGGVNALTACLAFETADQGIRVNAVAPGGTAAPPRGGPPPPPRVDGTTWP